MVNQQHYSFAMWYYYNSFFELPGSIRRLRLRWHFCRAVTMMLFCYLIDGLIVMMEVLAFDDVAAAVECGRMRMRMMIGVVQKSQRIVDGSLLAS